MDSKQVCFRLQRTWMREQRTWRKDRRGSGETPGSTYPPYANDCGGSSSTVKQTARCQQSYRRYTLECTLRHQPYSVTVFGKSLIVIAVIELELQSVPSVSVSVRDIVVRITCCIFGASIPNLVKLFSNANRLRVDIRQLHPADITIFLRNAFGNAQEDLLPNLIEFEFQVDDFDPVLSPAWLLRLVNHSCFAHGEIVTLRSRVCPNTFEPYPPPGASHHAVDVPIEASRLRSLRIVFTLPRILEQHTPFWVSVSHAV
jgi:hypothetical protein